MFAQNRPASIILCALSTLALTAAPYRVGLNGPQPTLSVHEASAKEGGNGKGTGSKGGGASGKDAGAGNNKGSGGKAGSPQSSGKAPDGTRERKPDDKSGGKSLRTKAQQTKRLSDGIAILHSNGMREKISGDRYEMRDAGGRTIVNRPATQSDLARLLRFQR